MIPLTTRLPSAPSNFLAFGPCGGIAFHKGRASSSCLPTYNMRFDKSSREVICDFSLQNEA